MSHRLFGVNSNSFSLDSTVPHGSLPLYHLIHGGGFPTTGQVKVIGVPNSTVSFAPLEVADGETKWEKQGDVKAYFNGGNSSEVLSEFKGKLQKS